MDWREVDRELFVALRENNGMYYIHNDWNYVDEFYASSDEEAIKEFRDRIAKHELARDYKIIQGKRGTFMNGEKTNRVIFIIALLIILGVASYKGYEEYQWCELEKVEHEVDEMTVMYRTYDTIK